jgi:catechol 2,3-dioxygenase-like lactoylglutathione lyase family enzyme
MRRLLLGRKLRLFEDHDVTYTTSHAAPRGLDHLVIGVRDLDDAGRHYEKMGFTVGARNVHPWGTHNRIVQFPGAFLELITVGDASRIKPPAKHGFSFGAFVQSALKRREGLSMLVLESDDAKRDSSIFKAEQIGDFETFYFERTGQRPDGSKIDLAFTLAFAQDRAAKQCGFFVCQQHKPENFWNPAVQYHANGVTGLSGVYLVAENPTDHHIFLSSYTGERSLRSNSLGVGADLPRGRVEIITGQAASAIFADKALSRAGQAVRFLGFAVKVADIAATERSLIASGFVVRHAFGRLVVPAQTNYGTSILFEAG